MRRGTSWIALAALLAIACGAAAAADELVTRDGQIIKTKGPWEVRGKLLVFKLADGTLASLRLDEADLEASERRARAAAEARARRSDEAARAQPSEAPEATFVLTDRDVARAPDLGEEPEPEGGSADVVTTVAGGGQGDQAAAGEADGEAGPGGAVEGSGQGVQVVQWSQEVEDEEGLVVRGVIQNLGSSFATSLSVNALFYDESGGLVAAREVQFEDGPLGPGARRDFSVSLPDSLIYDEIRFQVVGQGFRSVGQSVFTQPRQPDLDELEEAEPPR